MTIDTLINQVLTENNKHWLNPQQAEWNIQEGRIPITREDVHDIIKKMPVKIYGKNISVEITQEGIIVKDNDFKIISRHIGVIASKHEDFRIWVKENGIEIDAIHNKLEKDGTMYHNISTTTSMRGLRLDEIIETPNAWHNPNYNEIIESVKYCLFK